MSSTREAVSQILDHLFTGHGKEKADRLLLVQEDRLGAADVSNARYLGGYSRLVIRDLLLDALQQREQEVRAGAWLPIESAPRDRSSFLIYCPESGDVYQAYRFEGEEQFRMFNSGGRVIYQSPSLWQPLPPPPAIRDSAPQEGEPR